MGQQNSLESEEGSIETALPMLGLRERKKRLRLQRIMDVSRALFKSKGFQNTTIHDIAEGAGIGLGTLYLYAKGKEDLLVLVFREHLLQMTESAFDTIDPQAEIIDQLMQFFEVHIDYYKEDRLLSRTVLKELSFPISPQRRHDIELIFDAAYQKLSLLLRRGINEGKIDSRLYVGTAVSSIFGLFYHLLQVFLCDFFCGERFRKNLRHALSMLLSDSLSK